MNTPSTDTLKHLYADVDFQFDGELVELSELLSERVFGKIRFTGQNTGIWDEVPAVQLEALFLGLHVELGGEDGHYGLIVTATAFPWDRIPTDQQASASVDFGEYVMQLLENIPRIRRET